MSHKRTPPAKKAAFLARYFVDENPDYIYLRKVFQCLRENLGVEVYKKPKKLPFVPSEEDLKKFYDTIWRAKNNQDTLIIKTFLYTGVRVSELINIRIRDIDLKNLQIRINQGKGKKDRIVPIPSGFKELLGLHINHIESKGSTFLFESRRKKHYTDRGIRKIFERYSGEAGLERSISPHQLRHFLLTWLKKSGIDDALIQPYSGHASRKSLEVYSKLSLKDAQVEYEKAMESFPI